MLFLSPPWCYRFQRNGPGGQRGCSKPSGNCRFFHPPLCQNALKTGICLSKGCKEVHIKGTVTSESGLKNSKTTKKPSGNDIPRNAKNQHQKDSYSSRDRNSKPSGNSSYSSSDERPKTPRKSRSDSTSSRVSDTPEGRTRSVSFSKSENLQDNEDFRKQLSQLKADLSQELAASIHTALQAMYVFHQQSLATHLPRFAQQMHHQMHHQPSPQFTHHSMGQFHPPQCNQSQQPPM